MWGEGEYNNLLKLWLIIMAAYSRC